MGNELKPCPFCDNSKCSVCDMGDDTGCPDCIAEDFK